MTRNEFIASTAALLFESGHRDRLAVRDAASLADELELQDKAPWQTDPLPMTCQHGGTGVCMACITMAKK